MPRLLEQEVGDPNQLAEAFCAEVNQFGLSYIQFGIELHATTDRQFTTSARKVIAGSEGLEDFQEDLREWDSINFHLKQMGAIATMFAPLGSGQMLHFIGVRIKSSAITYRGHLVNEFTISKIATGEGFVAKQLGIEPDPGIPAEQLHGVMEYRFSGPLLRPPDPRMLE